MAKALEKIEQGYKVPCGAMDVSADSVCRRSLTSGLDKLLDRLTQEVNPLPVTSASLPKGLSSDETGKLVVELDEDRDGKLERLIEDGKLRAEARLAIKHYQETLQGNSKLLHDITGKIHPRAPQ